MPRRGSNAEGKPRRRRLRRVLFVLAALILLTAVAPTIITRTIGPGLVAGVIETKLNADVEVDRLRGGWFTRVQVGGLRLTHKGGGPPVADIDLSLNSTLLDLLFGVDVFDITATGQATVVRGVDGTFDIVDLIPPSDEPSGPPPALHLAVRQLALMLRDAATGSSLILPDAAADLDLDGGGGLRGSITAQESGGGDIHVAAAFQDLFDSTGAFRLDHATWEVGATLTGLPLGPFGAEGTIQSVQFKSSTDSMHRITGQIEATGLLGPANEQSTVDATFTLADLFDDSGDLRFDPHNFQASVRVQNLPTAPFQGLTGDSDIDLERDVGSVIETLAVEVGPDISLDLQSTRLAIELRGIIEGATGAVSGDRLLVQVALDPALVASRVPLQLDSAAKVMVSLDRFHVPARREGALDQRAIAGRGRIQVEPLHVRWNDEPTSGFDLDGFALDFDAPSLGESLTLVAEASVEGASLKLVQRLTNLFDEAGTFSFDTSRAEGNLTIAAIPTTMVNRFLPDHAATIEAVLGQSFDVSLQTAGSEALTAAITVEGGNLNLTTMVEPSMDLIRIRSAGVDLTLTDESLAALQPPSDEPAAVQPQLPVTVRVDLDSTALTRGDAGWGPAPDQPLVARVRCNEIGFDALPGVAQRLGVAELDVTATLDVAGPLLIGIDGAAHLFDGVTFAAVANTRFDVVVERAQADAPLALRQATAQLTEIDVAALERALGRDTGTYSTWIGDYGTLKLTASQPDDGYQWSAEVHFDRLGGALAGRYADDWLVIEPTTVQWTIDRMALNDRLAGIDRGRPVSSAAPRQPWLTIPFPRAQPAPPPAAASPVADTPLQLEGDIVARLAIRNWHLPLGPTEAVADQSAGALDVELSTQPFALTRGGVDPMRFESFQVALASDDLAGGVAIRITGEPEAIEVPADGEPADAEPPSGPGRLEIRGELTNVLNEHGALDFTGGQLTGSVNITEAPTALIDAIAGFDGLLLAAVGPQITLQAGATAFSKSSGRLDFNLSTDNAKLKGDARSVEHTLFVDADKPVGGSLDLTPALRSRILAPIHPVLADVRSIERAIQFDLDDAALPLDGDLRRLNGTLTIDIGAVQLDAGSTTLFLLAAAKSTSTGTFAGSIEPIKLRIRNGVVSYDLFRLTIDKYTLNYTGSIDLVTREVNLRTQVPLEGLALTFRELSGYADKIIVPIVTRGTIGSLKTQIDPSFNMAEAALRAGFEGALQNQIKELDIIKDVFDIFSGGRRKGGGG